MLKYFNTSYPCHLTSNTWTTGCKWHVNIGKFPGRLSSCGNPLPTDCLHNVLVRALSLATDSSEIFWPLILTMRNLFSLTSNAIWPIMTKSRSPKSENRNRNLWRQVISPCGQPSHCPIRAFQCLRVRIHACLFCPDGREPVFAGLIGLLFDSWGGNKQPTGSSCESKQ